jgi:hypothetical protein
MTVDDFKEYFRDLLANSGHAAIGGVDMQDAPGSKEPLKELVVRGTDNVTLHLTIVRTSPPGGDKPGREIVTKPEPGVQVITSA